MGFFSSFEFEENKLYSIIEWFEFLKIREQIFKYEALKFKMSIEIYN